MCLVLSTKKKMGSSYNAVVRDDMNNIFARTLFTHWSKLPWTWTVTYNQREVVTLTPSTLCDSFNPLTIKRLRKKGAQEGQSENYNDSSIVKVKVRNIISQQVTDLSISSSDTGADLHGRIPCNTGVTLLFGRSLDMQIRNTGELIKDLGFKNGQDLVLIPNGSLVAFFPKLVNPRFEILNTTTDTGCFTIEGIPVNNPKKSWKGYSAGLNVIGKCSKKSCPSYNRWKSGWEDVYFRFGFQRDVVTIGSRSSFECPACKGVYVMAASNFLIAGARAMFRITTKTDVEIQTVILESRGPMPNYVRFREEGGKDMEYDYIEITTVELDKSPFTCILCNQRIEGRKDETQRECGHWFHKSCYMIRGNCPCCNARFVSEDEFANH